MSSTEEYFITRYHAVSNAKYDGWFLPNGILELGRALGPEIVRNVLKGCLPPIPVPDRQGTFEQVLEAMERGHLRAVKEPNVEDVTERGTTVLALSYRHLQLGTDDLPRRRMTLNQKSQLIRAITEIAAKRHANRVILWVDQAMGQRNPKDERDWVRHGILPYFAFDILVLREKYDLSRCWIFLERMIAEKSSLPEAILSGAVLHEKSYKLGTITPIQEVASAVLGGALIETEAYDESDKEQIRRWAAQLLRQKDASGEKYVNLLGGSTWESRYYDAEGLVAVISNHSIPNGEVKWRDLSKQNTDCRFHGLSELVGLPDKEATSDQITLVREQMRKLGSQYMFHVFSAHSDKNLSVKGIAIGTFFRSGRPSRTLLCALNGTKNYETTHVLGSCILDCDEITDSGALSFIGACLQLSKDDLGLLYKLHKGEDSPLVDAAKQKLEARHRALLYQLFEWKWFVNALQKAGLYLDCYVESMQAGKVKWG